MSQSITPELAALLRAYLAVQDEERALREKKTALQRQLAAHMQALGAAEWLPDVDGQRLKVRYRENTRIEYDETCLRERLGERYRLLLRPDLRKLRRHLDAVEPHLAEMLDVIGSPDPGRVKEAIETGRISAEEFQGAFEKRKVVQVAVSRPGGERVRDSAQSVEVKGSAARKGRRGAASDTVSRYSGPA